MTLYTLHTPPPMEDPVMIMGLAGWGDAASAASDATDWLAPSFVSECLIRYSRGPSKTYQAKTLGMVVCKIVLD